MIDDWLGVVSSGKEATVHLAAKGDGLLAVKVFKERNERSFRNRADYHMAMMPLHAREARAMANRSGFGKAVAEGLWCQREAETLGILSAAGADVPRVVAHGCRSIVMEYFGTAESGASRLSDIRNRLPDAPGCFAAVLRNLGVFLEAGIVHGDLSPYNILYHGGRPVIIDFPQAVLIAASSGAESLFERDVSTVCEYFRRQGVATDAGRVAHQLWSGHALRRTLRRRTTEGTGEGP
ncbi:MAG: serine protein kinase RIO [Candidatus Edwardsbacteria bacterium]|nr:serine protein kinase RIO [Candidatus Edwardsbacteria bacterium]